MKQQAFDNFDRLLEPKKLLSIGILCLIAFLIIWFIWRKVKDSTGDLVQKIKDDKQLNDYMDESKQSLSYTDQEYKSMAEQLYNAMYGPGTKNEVVKEVFEKMNNDADVYKLIMVFGKRQGWPGWGVSEETLYEWIDNDYASDYVNEILSRKGISVRF